MVSRVPNHLLLVEGAIVLLSGRSLCDVEVLVSLRFAVNVVERGIAVQEADRLADDHSSDMRIVLAAILIEDHGFLRRRHLLSFEPLAHIYEDVSDVSIGHH